MDTTKKTWHLGLPELSTDLISALAWEEGGSGRSKDNWKTSCTSWYGRYLIIYEFYTFQVVQDSFRQQY